MTRIKTMAAELMAACLVAGATGAGATGATAAQDRPPPEAFARMPTFKDVQVSPNGKRLSALWRSADADEYAFVVFDRPASGGLDLVYAVKQDDKFRVSDPFWANDETIVFSLRFNANRYGTDTVETRLMAVNPDDGEIYPLFKADRRQATGTRRGGTASNPIQIQTNIVSRNAADPNTILVEYSRDGRYGVHEVKVGKTARHHTVERGRDGVQWWYADPKGVVRAGGGIKDNERERRLVMRLPDGKWTDASHRVAEDAPSFRILGFPTNPSKAFVASDHATETDALYIYDVPTDSFGTQLFHSPESDVYGVVQQAGTGHALGVTFATDEGETHWFGENFARDVLRRMNEALDGQSVTLQSLNETQTHAVIHAEEPGRPGRYLIYDIEAGRVTALPDQYPDLADADFGAVVRVGYEARDGLDIPAYVTLPPGVASLEEARDLPFVLFPHGGPNARDFAGFDWWAQFLASRGYGVMQMNFRGSSGYGAAFRQAGDRQWGQAMQDDITDGAGWLVEQGHADPERLAIMGGSYGGYAALMGAVKTPDLYQCAAAFAPVTDLPRLLGRAKDYVGGEYRTRHIGRLWSDRSMLRANSPALHADQIEVPILLVHGEDDRVVDIDQSERMVTGMKRQGAEYRYVELPSGSHYLDVRDNRLTFLRELDEFLGGCLDG